MRLTVILLCSLLVCGAASAQVNKDESSGIGPGGQGAAPGDPPKPPQPPATTGCSDPTFAGKYSNELRRLNMPEDRARYGVCRDYGPWAGTSYGSHSGLPRGYWVYSFPYWIIYANRGTPGQ